MFIDMANGFKTGGRKKGTENKITTDIREKFNQLLSDNINCLDEDLKALEPKERINAILQLSKFVIPQLKTIEQTNINQLDEENNKPEIKIIFNKPEQTKA